MSQIRMFSTLDISASGLSAQRARMNVIAQNIANAGTTHTEAGEPYQRQEVVLEAVSPDGPTAADPAAGALAPAAAGGTTAAPSSGGAALPILTGRDRETPVARPGGATASAAAAPEAVSGGVRVASIRRDPAEFPRVYDPSHPDADEEGYVRQPNVNMVNEMVDLMMAARAYEANLAVMNASKDLLMRTLTIGKQ